MLIKEQPALMRRADEEEYFQRHYGLGPHHQRDDRRFGEGPSISASDVARRQVIAALSDILMTTPIASISRKIISKISQKAGVNEREVERIITQIEVKPSWDAFEQTYLQFAFGERIFASDFEKATEGIFGEDGLGFETEWVGPKPNNPDILTISLDDKDNYMGILDTKAYQQYSVSSNHRRAMVHDYIPKYRNFNYKGQEVPLEFFGYIAGGFKSTIDANLERVSQEGELNGFAITAQDLLRLLRKHRGNIFPKKELKNLFSINRQVLPTDFNKK